MLFPLNSGNVACSPVKTYPYLLLLIEIGGDCESIEL